jgi:hypothetical protein
MPSSAAAARNPKHKKQPPNLLSPLCFLLLALLPFFAVVPFSSTSHVRPFHSRVEDCFKFFPRHLWKLAAAKSQGLNGNRNRTNEDKF